MRAGVSVRHADGEAFAAASSPPMQGIRKEKGQSNSRDARRIQSQDLVRRSHRVQHSGFIGKYSSDVKVCFKVVQCADDCGRNFGGTHGSE